MKKCEKCKCRTCEAEECVWSNCTRVKEKKCYTVSCPNYFNLQEDIDEGCYDGYEEE